MKGEEIFARVISYLFHPLLFPSYGFLLIFNLNNSGLWIPGAETRWLLLGSAFTATFLLPVFNAIFLLKLQVISSLEMKTKEERRFPYLATAVCFFLESYFLSSAGVPFLINRLMLMATLLVIAVLLINFFWKISAHTVAIGGLCGMLVALSYRLQINLHGFIILLFIFSGMVAYARLAVRAHTQAQVYAGFFLGFAAQLILFF